MSRSKKDTPEQYRLKSLLEPPYIKIDMDAARARSEASQERLRAELRQVAITKCHGSTDFVDKYMTNTCKSLGTLNGLGFEAEDTVKRFM